MSIDKLNSAAWAAGFAMAPAEDERQEAAKTVRAEVTPLPASRWQSAKVPAGSVARIAPAGGHVGMRHWFASWQRKATA